MTICHDDVKGKPYVKNLNLKFDIKSYETYYIVLYNSIT